jgi:hypothetical protein
MGFNNDAMLPCEDRNMKHASQALLNENLAPWRIDCTVTFAHQQNDVVNWT